MSPALLAAYNAAESEVSRASIAILAAQLIGAPDSDIDALRRNWERLSLRAESIGDQLHASRLAAESAELHLE